jgi:hypothetical protein
MKYEIYGPYRLPRDRGLFSREARERADFWKDLEDEEEGLSEACGCYIISVRNVVWYVGVATSQSFRHECFTPHKINMIDAAINKGAGKANLHLIARVTSAGRFSRPSVNGHRDAELLESLLIGLGLRRNEELLNKSDTSILREIVVPGFYNSPHGAARATSVQALKLAMGVE